MKLKEKSLKEIKEILKKEKDFKDISKWKFEHIKLGEMQHKYKISKGKRVYFVKELKIHEAQMEYFLSVLKLEHLPYSLYPKLLNEKVLVRKFILGKMLRSKKIDLGLLRDFVIMRNKLNNEKFFDKYNILKLKNYSQKDDGFYEKGLKGNFAYAPRVLKKLGKYKLKEVDDFWKILRHIKKDKKSIIKDSVNMPFAKQHQDFREDNIIVGKDGKQKLIDWGSSYGYRSFMYDPVPFLVNNPRALKAYIKNSDNCKGISDEQIKRWIYVALAARFLDVIRWRLHPNEKRAETKKSCKKFLSYEYKTYRELLK